MLPYKIKDLELASRVTQKELDWNLYISPITAHYSRQIKKKDYSGKRLAYWGHITFQNSFLFLPLKEAGADIIVGACNVDSTNDAVAAYLVSKGISVYGWRGMTQADYDYNLSVVREFRADYLCDMGGELISVYLKKKPPVKGALEATTSGITRLAKQKIPFPVFDWNNIPIKDRLENRFHVGDTVWPAFSYVTGGLGIFGRRVLVIGYGSVGKGIAERARNLGASVYVVDLDPVRLLEARHHGCETLSLKEGLAHCDIVVTATGVEGIIKEEQLKYVKNGAFLFNAGHSNRELDIDFIYKQPHREVKDNIDRVTLGNKFFFLLGKGSLLNLAVDSGPRGIDLFDHYIAIMLRGIAWMFDGIPAEISPGMQLYPAELEREIAALSIKYNYSS